jgi:hypothetical protein
MGLRGKMHRRFLLASVVLPLAWPARAVASWSLVTDTEFARDAAAPRKALTRALPVAGAPQIQVERPDTEAQLPRPFSVKVRFVPAPDAKIVPSTFRATYGWLEIDITQRLLEHATLSTDGLSADDINAPAGQHRVTVSIADTRGRVGARTFRFTIA